MREETRQKRPKNHQPGIGDGDFVGGAEVQVRRWGAGFLQQVQQMGMLFGAQSEFGGRAALKLEQVSSGGGTPRSL